MMQRFVYAFRSAPRHARMALALACLLLCLPVTSFAAQNKGLVVTPLGDDLGRGEGPGEGNGAAANRLPGESVPFFNQGAAPGQDKTPPQDDSTAGDLGTSASGGPPPALQEPPSYKDGIIMAYLVELMRKQGKPCPSGAQPPLPPSLLFSEPLCRVAESVGKGVEFPVAYEQQGLYASRWRMFSAADQPAQQVATRLREQHCEALLEPYTHIGAWRGGNGWRIVLATLTEKPAATPGTEPQAAPQPAPSESGATPPAAPVPPQTGATPSAGAAPATPAATNAVEPQTPPLEYAVPAAKAAAGQSAPVTTPAPAAIPAPGTPATGTPPSGVAPRPDLAPLSGMTPAAAPATPAPAQAEPAAAPAPAAPVQAVPAQAVPVDAASRASGQEARALFQLMNDLRAKGGSCLGKPSRTATPLAFDAGLQAAAEKEAADAAAKGSFGMTLGVSPDMAGGAVNYRGVKVSKLTATSRPPASVVLDVWMVNPARCDMLLSSEYQDAGAAYVDGYWVVLMGQRVAPSPAAVPAGK